MNYPVYLGELSTIDFDKVKILNTINPHSYCVAKNDIEFQQALKASDVLLPDGIGIVWAQKLLKGKRIKKIAGYDLFVFLMHRANSKGHKVFFLGAAEETLKKIKKKAAKEYPNVKVLSYSPPYKAEFSEADSVLMCKKVNDVNPNLLFVGMTAPKQEKWVYQFKDRLNVDIISSVGAVFDFYAGTVKRPSLFWINLGLEWLPRLLQEPRRLFKRNFVSTPKFILEVLSYKLFKKGFLF